MSGRAADQDDRPRVRDPVVKAFAALVHMVESGEPAWSARRLAADLNVPLSTAHRTLTSLSRAGLLEQEPGTSLYVVGRQLHRISRILVEAFPLPELARPYLEALARETQETSLLGVFDPTRLEMMFVAQVEGSHPLRYVIPLHAWIPVHLGASGLGILSFLDAATRDRVLDRLDEPAAVVRALRKEIAATRERGHAISHGRRIPGAVAVAAPIFGAHERVIGDVVVTIPETRFAPELEPKFVAAVTRRARELTADLGGRAQAASALEARPRGRASR
jgi:DNA-binding IclR family transcriptional regulator